METVNESDEEGEFLYYGEAVKINNDLFDHTYDGTTGATYYATRLTGGNTNSVWSGEIVAGNAWGPGEDGGVGKIS